MTREKIGKYGAVAALACVEAVILMALAGVMIARGAALTDGIPLISKAEAAFPVPAYEGVLYRGGLVAVSNGVAYPAAENAAYRVIGVAAETVDNSSGDGLNVVVRQGIFGFANAYSGSGTNRVFTLGASDVGKLAYVVDDQTVGKKGTGTNTVAGTVVQVEATGDRWVWLDVGKVWTSSVTTNTLAQ